MSYRCVLVDPPWPEYGGGKVKRGADRYYRLLKAKDLRLQLPALCIQALHERNESVFDDAHLWCWVTNNYLRAGLQFVEDMGFRYISNVAWAKASPVGLHPEDDPRAGPWMPNRPGLGQYLAGQHELLLFGVRGKLPALWKDKTSGARRQGTLLLAPRREHSRKPDEAYTLIESVSPGPRLELFARHRRDGWDAWGNEIEGDPTC